SSMSEENRKIFLDQRIFTSLFKERKIKPSKPYFKFSQNENPIPAIERYLTHRYELFKDQIDTFFNSETVKILLEQYSRAAKLKRAISTPTA
ncbi:MAG: hypothetical protein AABX39_06470, partial [Nanoarchaeota archaeon]